MDNMKLIIINFLKIFWYFLDKLNSLKYLIDSQVVRYYNPSATFFTQITKEIFKQGQKFPFLTLRMFSFIYFFLNISIYKRISLIKFTKYYIWIQIGN